MGQILELPQRALVVLVGPSGSGKSTWAARNFSATQIVSSDHYRGVVSDDETDQECSGAAFRLVHQVIDERLKYGRLTVVDSTALTRDARRQLLGLAAKHDVPAYAVMFNASVELCLERNLQRERQVPESVIERHGQRLGETMFSIFTEGFTGIHSVSPIDPPTVKVLFPYEVDESGPFDIIGDVHGCLDELRELLQVLGYREEKGVLGTHPEGRKPVFVGDLVDRGPSSLATIWYLRRAILAGDAYLVEGNHDNKLHRYLLGRKVQMNEMLEETLRPLQKGSKAFREWAEGAIRYLLGLAYPYLVLDGGNLVVSHAGIEEHMIGKDTNRVRAFCLYGDSETGDGRNRRDWASTYYGKAVIAYGHTVQDQAFFRNNTINLDTGCVYGGELSALRYPEREIVSVPARTRYA